MKIGIILTSLSFLSAANTYGQNIEQKDSIEVKSDSLNLILNKNIIPFDSAGSVSDFKEPGTERPTDFTPSVDSMALKLRKPFFLPSYYPNPSPMFYGDYSTGGQILPNLYGRGLQTTLPSIGRINEISFLYQHRLNDYFDIQAGLDATKYSFPMSIGQSFGASGALIYHPNDRFRITAFGSYTPSNRYGFNQSSYGATLGYDFTDRFGMEVGVRRYYDPMRGWQTVPIAIPYYKFNKFNLGVDVGGILYEVIHTIIIDKRQGGSPVIAPPIPGH